MPLRCAVLGLAVVIPMAGCASGPSVEERIGSRILELSEVVDDVRVDLQRDIFKQEVVLELAVSRPTDEALASAVAAAYEGSWVEADFEPTAVAVRVSDQPLTEDRADQNPADYVDLGALNDLGEYDCREEWCSAPAYYLEDRFGPWGEQ